MATKSSKRLTKLTDKMAESRSARQTRKPRRVVVQLSKVMSPPKTVKSFKITGTTKQGENKSTKTGSSNTRGKDALLDEVKSVEQVEYYPDKLKRKILNKKIVLRPKHNFTVVAATNKRKLCTPHREVKSQRKTYKLTSRFTYKPVQTSTSLSVQDMVMMIDEASLNDEDFMEILTCPSPVWWEDPPDGGYVEDPICAIMTDKYLQEEDIIEVAENPLPSSQSLVDYRTIDKTMKLKPVNKGQNGMFIKKQRKLESILSNIVQKLGNTEEKNNEIDNFEKSSNCTDESIDLNLNDDVLCSLENIEIPIQSHSNNSTKKENSKVPNEMPPLTRKPVFKNRSPVLSDSNSEFDSISDTNIRFISDDEFCSNETNSDEIHSLSSNVNKKQTLDTTNCKYNKEKNDIVACERKNQDRAENKKLLNKIAINDLSEYITVYKIIPEPTSAEKKLSKNQNAFKNKIIGIRSKLNNFFKTCKNNKRLKTAISISNVKDSNIESNSVVKTDEQNNRLKLDDNYEMEKEF